MQSAICKRVLLPYHVEGRCRCDAAKNDGEARGATKDASATSRKMMDGRHQFGPSGDTSFSTINHV